jgi:prephenate dehydrogenase
MIKHLAILGVGLIGSSLALALRETRHVQRVSGFGRNRRNLERGVELGVLDDFSLDLGEVVSDADMVLVAVPLGAMAELFAHMAPLLPDRAVITDVGSAKGSVVNDARNGLGDHFARFVAGHPIAGTERSGVEAGFATLFQQRKVILTPTGETETQAVDRVRDMWLACGAGVELMAVEHHDQVLAATSHLPHMLAFSLVSHLSKMSDQDEIFDYAAGGFRDFTRIASSDPVMWRDICIANRDALIDLIEGYQQELTLVADAIRRQDPDALQELFTDAKHTRDQLRNL